MVTKECIGLITEEKVKKRFELNVRMYITLDNKYNKQKYGIKKT